MAAKKGGRFKAYYENQKHRTASNKLKLKQRRERRMQKWLKLGVKKNGKPVMTVEQRKARLVARKELRSKQVSEQRPRQHRGGGYRGNNPRTPRTTRAPRAAED
jgi:hypothetical protein